MNRRFAIPIFCFLSSQLCAQDFPGYRAGNYTGVNGVFFNPANIADSRYRWDFNLISLSTSVGNNQASFRLENIGDSFIGDSLKHQFVGKKAGLSSGMVSANLQGPSFMFNTGRKSTIALTTRSRIMMLASDIDGKLAEKILDDVNNDRELPYTISSASDMRVNVNAWTEFGLSYGRVLKDDNEHFLKGGISLKYLAGVANGYVRLGNLNGTINEDPVTGEGYLQNSTGRLELGLGGINLSDFDAAKLTSFKSTGFGADIGFVYEYRPGKENFKIDSNHWRRDMNKYKFRIGIALLDFGSIKYDRDIEHSGAYDINISGAEQFYLNQLDGVVIDSLKNFFDTHPQYFTGVAGNNAATYKVGLPTTMQIDADYHFHRGFYVNLASQLSLVSKNKPYNSQYYSSVTITPRYEGRAIGLYLPLSYNKLTSFNAGVSLRIGPLFVGSGSILTSLMGNSRQADLYMGLRFGGLQKNQLKKEQHKKKKAAKKAGKSDDEN